MDLFLCYPGGAWPGKRSGEKVIRKIRGSETIVCTYLHFKYKSVLFLGGRLVKWVKSWEWAESHVFLNFCCCYPVRSYVHDPRVFLLQIPVFMRGGSIIPTRERIRRAASLMSHDPITLYVALNNHVSRRPDNTRWRPVNTDELIQVRRRLFINRNKNRFDHAIMFVFFVLQMFPTSSKVHRDLQPALPPADQATLSVNCEAITPLPRLIFFLRVQWHQWQQVWRYPMTSENVTPVN